jgi:hypothetical protein
MAAYNVVRFRVKPGRDEDFIDAHRRIEEHLPGFRRGSLIHTGDRSYCFIGEWDSAVDTLNAEARMISILDSFRDTLEDLGGGLGVTDPVSGEVVLEVEPR